ncbi:MAG: hypothetical protein KDC34_17785 [Saprospiraceae bacterium]|nr:hypothetical protein [Saprospiraceae bacterium]
MNQHFGTIELGRIENSGQHPQDIELITAKFVHYPDSQQLILWLPQNGRQGYGSIRLIDETTHEIITEDLVEDRLNGSIQILINTISVPPGKYLLEIEHPKGGKHVVRFKKLEEGEKTAVGIRYPIPEPGSEPILYRDGSGSPLPEEDVILRQKLFQDMEEKFTRHIEYEGNFRSGKIIYKAANTSISFYHEMGGGDCKFYIDIPTPANWETATKTPLSSRAEILEFVAATVQRERASSWRFEIKENGIFYY